MSLHLDNASDTPLLHSTLWTVLARIAAVCGAIVIVAVMIIWPAGMPVESIPRIIKASGRFHILILHLPIGILSMLAAMEFLPMSQAARTELSSARRILLWASSASLVVAAILGHFLSLEGGFKGTNVNLHRWLEVGAAGSSLLTLALAYGFPRWVHKSVLAVSLTLMSIGAHFGGNISHGDIYLTEFLIPAPETVSKALSDKDTIYKAIVAPILEAKCTSCHKEDKQKGDLRLDQYAFIIKGGKNAPDILPGNARGSLLIKQLHLPPDDDDHMPPEGKTEMTPDEIKLLEWWIDNGAEEKMCIAEPNQPAELAPILEKVMKKGGK